MNCKFFVFCYANYESSVLVFYLMISLKVNVSWITLWKLFQIATLLCSLILFCSDYVDFMIHHHLHKVLILCLNLSSEYKVDNYFAWALAKRQGYWCQLQNIFILHRDRYQSWWMKYMHTLYVLLCITRPTQVWNHGINMTLATN